MADSDGIPAVRPPGVRCVAHRRFPVAVVCVTGRLDLAGAARVRGFLLTCLADQPAAVVVDLAGLTVADEHALTLLPALTRQAAEWPGAELLLSASPRDLVATLERAGVTEHLRVFPTQAEAVAVAARRPAPRRLRRHMASTVDAPRQARELVAQAAARWRLDPQGVPVAQLIATELVNNAVLHARTPITVTVVLRERCLHVAVADGDPRCPRLRTVSAEHDDHGRGLLAVDGLAQGWGCAPTAGGKVVWARLSLVPPPGGIRAAWSG